MEHTAKMAYLEGYLQKTAEEGNWFRRKWDAYIAPRLRNTRKGVPAADIPPQDTPGGDTGVSMTEKIDSDAAKPFLKPEMSRRDYWHSIIDPDRADKVIADAEKYRADHPEIFEQIFNGKNIDRQIPVKPAGEEAFLDFFRSKGVFLADEYAKKEQGLYHTPGTYRSNYWSPWVDTRDNIMVKQDADWRVLGHELLHPDTVGSVPQDWESALDLAKGGEDAELSRQYKLIGNDIQINNSDALNVMGVTDKVYPSYVRRRAAEVGSQVGTLRMWLEQQGVDTTSDEAIREALQNLHNYKGDNEEADRFRTELRKKGWRGTVDEIRRRPAVDPQKLESMIKLMRGIARNDTPYRSTPQRRMPV